MNSIKSRLEGLDFLRGTAIILMIIFHFCYDLNYFNFINIRITHDRFWVDFRLFIVTLFLLAVGVSLALVHKERINWQKIKKRVLVLLLSSVIVTIATYIIFPHSWVYFGILHSILILSLIGLLFVNRGWLAVFVSIFILIGYNFFDLNMHLLFNLLKKPLHLPAHTVDLVPIIPWLGIVLIGIAIVEFNMQSLLFDNRFYNIKALSFVKFMGRHSLIIYLIHQPILFSILWLVWVML